MPPPCHASEGQRNRKKRGVGEEPGLKRDFISCSRTQPLVSWRHYHQGRARFPTPRGEPATKRIPAVTTPPKATGDTPSNICSSSRLPSRLVPPVLVAVDIEHFQSFKTHLSELASVSVRFPSSASFPSRSPSGFPLPPPLPAVFPFRGVAWLWRNGHHDSGSTTRDQSTPRFVFNFVGQTTAGLV